MRRTWQLGWLVAAISACGNNSPATSPDAPTGNHPPPRVIAGGGIGDGAIDGVVNLYVIDDATRLPIGNASVQVGTVAGTTDSTGLFVADGVTGAQTISVAAASYKSALWIGANGANVTVDLTLAADPLVMQANLSGSIVGFGSITPAAGHHKTAIVTYSQLDSLPDAENNIQTTGSTNFCDTGIATDGCSFTVAARTGTVGLIAAIVDHDLKGTPTDPSDDTYTLTGWATRTGITVEDGVDLAGQDLTLLAVGDMTSVTASFGSPPSGLPNVEGIIGVDIGTSGTFQLPFPVAPTSATLLAPALGALPGSSYRFTGIANNGSTATAAQSIVLARGQTSTALTSDAWLAPPTGLALTRSGGSWTTVSGAVVQGVDFDQDATHHLLSVTIFDGSTSFTIPSQLALPATGTLTGKGTALAAAIDVTNFGLDADRDKITSAASQPMTIN